MELYYEYDNYLKRLKTPLWQEKGRVLYYGIYDFSYKYRTRIFDVDDNEIAYVEKDITAEKPCVGAWLHSGEKLFDLYREGDEYTVEPQGYRFKKTDNGFVIDGVMTADEGKVTGDDIPLMLSLLFAMVEIAR